MRRFRQLKLELLEQRKLLSLSALGDQLTVNTYTEGTQCTFAQSGAPAVAIDADGDFVAVWSSSDQDGSGYGIYAQRFNSAGEPQDDEFRVNTTTSRVQSFAGVAMDDDGDLVVAWSSLMQDGDLYGVYAQRFNSAGEPQSDEFRVNTTTEGNQDFSAVAMDADGDFVIAWTSTGQDGDRTGVFAQRYDASGTPLGDEFQVNTTTEGNQRYPTVAMDTVGNFIITWTSQDQDGSGGGIFAQLFNRLAAPLGDEFQVNTTTAGNQQFPSVDFDSSGSVIVWQGFDPGDATWNVYAQQFDVDGVAEGEEILLGQGRSPAVTLGPRKDFVVGWETYDPASSLPVEIRTQHYDPLGNPLGDEVRISGSSGDQQSPSAATNGDHLVVFWTNESSAAAAADVAAGVFEVTLPDSFNYPPIVSPIADQAVDEGHTLTVTATATDPDDPEAEITFTLCPSSPDGARIDPLTGEFTWTPGEAHGPGVHLVTVRATDNGTPRLSGVASFSVTVSEVNLAPAMEAIDDQTVEVGEIVSLTAVATDADLPANGLFFSLDPGAPEGTTIDPETGEFSWNTDGQQVGTYTITVRVTDDGTPALDDTTTFSIFLIAPAPTLKPIIPRMIAEETTLQLTVDVANPHVPPETLTFSLDAGAAAGATIDPATGVFTWTPGEEQGPGVYYLTVSVVVDDSPPLGDSETLFISVYETNRPPALEPIGARTVPAGETLQLTAVATDPDLPANRLTFTLDRGAPEGATIDRLSGEFTWTPNETHMPGTYEVTVRVTDNGGPLLGDTETFSVIVEGTEGAPMLDEIGDQARLHDLALVDLLGAGESSRAGCAGQEESPPVGLLGAGESSRAGCAGQEESSPAVRNRHRPGCRP